MRLQCILSYIEFLCKMSVIVTGITGTSFVGSGKTVLQLFTDSFGNMSLASGIWWIPGMILRFFAMLLSMCWGGVTGFIIYETIQGKGTYLNYPFNNQNLNFIDLPCAKFVDAFSMDPTYVDPITLHPAFECTDSDNCKPTADFGATCDALSLGLGLGLGFGTFIIVLYLISFFCSILLCIVDTVFMCFLIDKSKGIVTKPEIHAVLNEVISKKTKATINSMNAVQVNAMPPPMYVPQSHCTQLGTGTGIGIGLGSTRCLHPCTSTVPPHPVGPHESFYGTNVPCVG